MLKTPILAIFRGISAEHVKGLATACIDAGIDTIEVTMNTAGAPDLIYKFNEFAAGKLIVGAGTVLSETDFDTALKAGAAFMVSPVIDKKVMSCCADAGIPVFPGALTPTEVYEAWRSGAAMVKVFPAGLFGSEYLKDLHGPLEKVKLMAVGGVNITNIAGYFRNGAAAVAVGGSIFSQERLKSNQYGLISNDLKNLVLQIEK